MNAVFLDTVGLIALWNASDQWHPAANAAYLAFATQGLRVVTTTFILLECGNAASRQPALRADVCDTRRALEARQALIVPTEDDQAAAWTAYQHGNAGEAGIVDHVSFAVMRRLGMTKAFTNDRHFRTAGFETLF